MVLVVMDGDGGIHMKCGFRISSIIQVLLAELKDSDCVSYAISSGDRGIKG